jgi:hypothetical protein
MTHVCHAKGCDKPVPPKRLMCKPHWNAVPRHLQQEVWYHYRPGQEKDKRPSAQYLKVMLAAIKAVAEQERLDQEELSLDGG